MSKEAIKPLEEALDYKADYAYGFMCKKIHQTIAILKEQPPTKWTVFRELLELDQKRYCLEHDDHRIANITKEQFEDFERLLSTTKEQPSTSEFLKGCRDLRKKGVPPEQWEYATKLGAACKIIDRSEIEIKRINAGWAMEIQLRENLLQENCRYEMKIKELESKEQPPAGEWTKIMRERWLPKPINIDRILSEAVSVIAVACDRLDRSKAEIKKYVEMDKYKSKQIILGTENYNRICKRVEQLKASRKELLTALKELAATFVGLPEGSIGGQAMKKANDAIKKGD